MEELDLTGYKLTTFYQSKSSVNSGIIKPVSATNNVFTIDLPTEMMVAGDTAVCFSLGNDKEVLGSIIFDFVIQRNLMTVVANEVNNNLSDFQKLFLAQLPTDIVERLNSQLALIAKKADQIALDATNTEVAKKATITSVNQKLPIVSSDSASTGLAYTITSANIPTLANGYSFKFIPTITSTVQTATLAINGGTAYPFAKANSYTGDKVALSASNAPANFLKVNVVYTLTYTGSQFAISEEQAVDTQSLSGIVPVEKGGTGNANGALKTYKAYSYSADGSDRFTTVYPKPNLLNGTKTHDIFVGTGTANAGGTQTYTLDKSLKISDLKLNSYQQLIFEFDWKATGTNPSGTFVYQTPTFYKGTSVTISPTNTSGHVKNTFYNLPVTTDASTFINARQDNIPSNVTVEVSNVMMYIIDYSPWMPSSSESTLADYPSYMGTLTTFSSIQSNSPSGYLWEKATNHTDLRVSTIETTLFAVGSVITNTSSTSAGYTIGTWSNIGSQTVGSTVVYYWKRTA